MSKLTIYFIRHGTTRMNIEGKFCGRTDTVLDPKGWEELFELKETYQDQIPIVDRIYCSPAIRCRETASVYFPGQKLYINEDLWEFDFGIKEGCSAPKMFGTETFNIWLAQEPDCGFIGGETLLEAKFRALSAMTRIVHECRTHNISTIAVVAHGAILARTMRACLVPEEYKDSFSLCPNGMGLVGTVDTDQWFETQEIQFERFFPEGAPRLKPEDSPYFAKK